MSTLPTLRQGSKGAAVEYLQTRLAAKGYHLTVDGDFGPGTDAAVEQFQAGQGLTADGIVGGRTWAALQVEGVAPTPSELVQEQRDALEAKIPANAPEIVRKALSIACQDLGKKEQVVNGNSINDGPDIHRLVQHYNQYWWVLKPGQDIEPVKKRGYPTDDEVKAPQAWCGMACSNWIREALGLPYWNYKKFGSKLEGHPFEQFFGGPGPVEEWAAEKGCWFEATAGDIMPAGALFTISRAKSGSDPSTSPTAGHIGMVVCDNGDGTVTTIEGNVSNGVGSYTRKKTDLRGYATWW